MQTAPAINASTRRVPGENMFTSASTPRLDVVLTAFVLVGMCVALGVAVLVIVYAGSSNFAGWDIATACQEASRVGKMGLVSEQSIYHLDNRMVELEVVPACREYGLGLIPWSPLGGGLLGGALKKLASGRRSSDDFRDLVEAKRDQLSAYEAFCRELGLWASKARAHS